MDLQKVEETAKKLRSMLEGNVDIHVTGSSYEMVTAEWCGMKASAKIDGTRADLYYINRAAQTALDKLSRLLAETYVKIGLLLECAPKESA